MDPEEVSESGGVDDYESAPTTPLPVLGSGITQQLRVVAPMTQTGGDFQAESVDLVRFITSQQRNARQRHLISERERCVIL